MMARMFVSPLFGEGEAVPDSPPQVGTGLFEPARPEVSRSLLGGITGDVSP